MLCYGYNDSPPLNLKYILCFVAEIIALPLGCNPKRHNHKSMLCYGYSNSPLLNLKYILCFVIAIIALPFGCNRK